MGDENSKVVEDGKNKDRCQYVNMMKNKILGMIKEQAKIELDQI